VKKHVFVAAALLVLASPAVLAQQHNMPESGAEASGGEHDEMTMEAVATPGARSIPVREGGQAAFAALTGIVTALDEDPSIDWRKVDLESVRQHLVDMDNVVMRTDVAASPVAGGARFVVTPHDARARQSIERLVGLHSSMANSEGRYRYSSRVDGGAVIVTVVAAKPQDITRVRALGFHGLLTEGVHHQRHHWAMARGLTMH